MKSRIFITPTVFLFAFLFGSSLLMAQNIPGLSQEKDLENQQKMFENQVQMLDRQMRAAENMSRTHSFGQPENRSSLVLSKRYDGETVSKSGNFIVDKETKEFNLSISGEVASGKIVLEIKKPTGEILQTLIMDDSADIRWDQSVAINEENKTNYAGKWTYKITTDKAKGEYRLSIRTK